jgi:hypothetical protein
METKLTIELVPSTSWLNNVRSAVSKNTWQKLKKSHFRAAGFKCEICGGRGPEWPVELHEVWNYDTLTLIQKLTGFIVLCPACHEVKHIGLAELNGNLDRAIQHLAKINYWSAHDARLYAEDAFELWSHRSHHHWTLDLSLLERFGIKIEEKHSA